MSMKKKLGAKLAQSVRQVKSQQGKPTQPATAKSQTLSRTSPAAISAKVSDPVSKPVETSPAHQSLQSGSNKHPLPVWPD